MKKLLMIMLFLLVISGCGEKASQDQPVEEKPLSIVTPKGAPVLAFYDRIGDENYTRVTADAISALWTGDASPDVLVVDLTSGINAIRNGAEYKVGAILTFGNYYLAATGNDEDGTLGSDDLIVLFGNENMLPNRLWHYLFGDEYDESLLFEADAAAAAAALTKGVFSDGTPVDYVLVAQPAAFAALKNNEKASIYLDIQKEYKDRSGMDMIQATAFISDRVSNEQANAFLEELEASINEAVGDPEKLAEGLSIYSGDEAMAQYGFNPDVVVNVFKQKNALGGNGMGLGYAKAYEIKDQIDAFLNIFGIPATDETFYIQ